MTFSIWLKFNYQDIDANVAIMNGCLEENRIRWYARSVKALIGINRGKVHRNEEK